MQLKSRWKPWVAGAVTWIVLVLVLDVASLHAQFPSSDQASLVLEGQALAHGNLLLHGWSLSLDSFWTAEVPFYALGSMLFGVNRLELSLVPAALAASVIVVGILLAADGRRRAAGIVACLTVLGYLALPIHPLARFFLSGGSHVGAVLWTLIAFYALRRGRWGIGVALAACSLTVGMLGDLLTLAYGTAPLFLAGILDMMRRRTVRSGLPAVSAAAAAGLLTVVIRRIADAIGTFGIGTANRLATLHQAESNLRHLYSVGGELVGLHSALFGTGGVPSWLADVHVAGAVVLVAVFLLYLVRLLVGVAAGAPAGPPLHEVGRHTSSAPPDAGRPPADPPSHWWMSDTSSWHLEGMLVLGSLGVASSYVALASTNNPDFARYLTASVIFVVILAARAVGRLWESMASNGLRRGVAAVGLAVGLCFAAGFGYSLTTFVGQPRAAALANWLEAHHLTNGVGAYWASNIVTVDSGGAVRVRPVVAVGGQLRRYGRESSAAWYGSETFSFVVYSTSAPTGGVTKAIATAACGQLASTDFVSGYVVFVCRDSFSLSPFS
jgi:hypothetical protein